jgi:outer membrane receptor for ferrienterochelin and colicin
MNKFLNGKTNQPHFSSKPVITFFRFFAMSGLVLFHSSLLAEKKTSDDDVALLEELQRVKESFEPLVEIASKSKSSQKEREAPAILTVITEKEILNSGARDLIDVLRLVPGFDFGVDSVNTVGPMIRGNWAYEGGILLLIDGLEMNGRRDGTIQFGQHYPIDNIQKIEVMRGPGSVIYGGFARLGVVNIITKGFNKANSQKTMAVKDKDELAITTRYGEMEKNYGHRGVSFYAGKNLTDDARLTVSAKASQAHRTDRSYTNMLGTTVNLENTNELENISANIGFQYTKDLTLRFILDDYLEKSTEGYLYTFTPPMFVSFKSYLFDIKYQHEFSDALKLSFNFDYSRQLPWRIDYVKNASEGYATVIKVATTRYLGGVRLDYALNNAIHITSGLEFTHEEFERLDDGRYDRIFPIVMPIFENITPYIESLIKTDWGQLTLGLRYDRHNTFEANLAPRVAFTNTIGNFHYKLLYSNSFRTPALDNVMTAKQKPIPERTKAYEMELGYQFNKKLSLVTNAFYLSTKGKLVSGFDPTPPGSVFYYNAPDKIETAGVETELRWKEDWGYLTFNHSYSQMLNNAPDFKPIAADGSTNSDMTLAFPSHKFTLNAHYEITPSLSVNPSLILTTSRYGYDRYDETDNPILRKYGPKVLSNLYFRYENLLTKGLELGVGFYNIFGVNHQFIQPYNGGHAPLPAQSREVIFKISYQM